MTRKSMAIAIACMAGVAAFTSAAQASDLKTWYVYCEGKVNGRSSAIFSANVWPHQKSEAYRTALAAAAERYIATSPGTKLSGCAGVPFHDQTIAAYNRQKTAKLARGIGDAVFYVEVPVAALPD